MLALLSILFALALLGLTVYALHKYQTMEVEFNVDRSAPLPPLDAELDSPRAEPKQGLPLPDRGRKITEKPSTQPAKPVNTKPGAATSSKSWQSAVTALKNTGQYVDAAALCKSHLPLWGAYNQLCLLLRTELKESPLSSPERKDKIASLYKTAAMAELLHDKSGQDPKLTNNQLRQLDLEAINQLEFPYAEIGYAHLRLIRKSDVKHLVEFWGRPATHRTPREYHSDWWQKQLKS